MFQPLTPQFQEIKTTPGAMRSNAAAALLARQIRPGSLTTLFRTKLLVDFQRTNPLKYRTQSMISRFANAGGLQMFTYTIADIIERYLKCVYDDGGVVPTRL